MLCMMWEAAQGSLSKWGQYLGLCIFDSSVIDISTLCSATLPSHFDTPMFWDDKDLKELEGTSVVGRSECFLTCRINLTHWPSEKLGKDDAERDYSEKVLPAILVRISWISNV